jgi:F0F1-type ATP synthase membrane subunit a
VIRATSDSVVDLAIALMVGVALHFMGAPSWGAAGFAMVAYLVLVSADRIAILR